jgi:hypothetical protein
MNTTTTEMIAARELQSGFEIAIPYYGGRTDVKTIRTVDITKGLMSDIVNVTFTDGSALDFGTGNPVLVRNFPVEVAR